MIQNDIDMARRLAERAALAGGRAYYVGGFVRDAMMGNEQKDVDVEVHGVAPEALEAILDALGERTVMGASFGIYGLKHYDLDIAMPRCEKATGRGHRDFQVYVDPFLGTEKAAKRRDFTVNAMMQDVLSGEIIDHFGGMGDLRSGVIRHVNDESFAEDPLRVLRGAQFAARFGFRVADETVAICSRMDLSALASERICGELFKALLKAARPSVFFDALKEMKQFACWFPEIDELSAEGAYARTMETLDRAALLREGANEPAAFMLAALCTGFEALPHLGSADEISLTFLRRISTEVRLGRYLQSMACLHAKPRALIAEAAPEYAYMKLFDAAFDPADLLLLNKACGRTDDPCAEALLHSMLLKYRALMGQGEVKGEDLIRSGMKPGKMMGSALAYAHDLHLRGISKETALQETILHFRKAP